MITFLSHYIAAGGAASPRKGCCCWQLDPPIETYPHPIQMHSLNLPNPFPVTGPSTGFGTLMSYHNSPGSSFTSLPMLASVLASPPLSNFPLPVPLQMVHHIAHQFQIVLRLQLLPHLCYIIQSCSLALLLTLPTTVHLLGLCWTLILGHQFDKNNLRMPLLASLLPLGYHSHG